MAINLSGTPRRQEQVKETLQRLMVNDNVNHMTLFAELINAYQKARNKLTSTRDFDAMSMWFVMATYREFISHFESLPTYVRPGSEEQEDGTIERLHGSNTQA